MSALLEVNDLHVGFAGTDVVRGVDLAVHAGRCVAIVGESGSGKSVTARALLGLNGPTAHVRATALTVDGRDARGFTHEQWDGVRGVFAGYVLQDALTSLDPLRTIGKEVGEVVRQHRVVPRDQIQARVLETLTATGFPDAGDRVGQYAHELSGGLRQRALIAAAVAAHPRVLIADEPTTALDVTVQRQVLDLLAERVAGGAGLLLVSHDLAVVSDIADEVLVMADGEIVEHGPTAQVLGDPQHERTRALLAAIPSKNSRGTRLSSPVTDRIPLPRRSIDAGDVVLRAQGLAKTYRLPGGGTTPALDDVGFELRRGEVLGIVGESGSGKSTAAAVVLGLLTPDAGTVELLGEPWSPLPERVRRERRRRVQFVPQDPLSSFDPRWTVERVLTEAVHDVRGRALRILAGEWLEKVGLKPEVLTRSPRTLSGGQRQRVAIARALAARPDVLVCDEPVSALDVSVQAQVLDLLADLQAHEGVSTILISHDLGVVSHTSDRVLVMQGGRVVESGTTDAVLETPQHAYTQALLAALPTIEREEVA
jgi:peptide/nickel transport system ATP-binding protein